MKFRRPKPTAFTLAEILIVTAVIGVLTGVGLVTVSGVREKARQTRLQNDVTVLNNGIDAYRAAGGVIPDAATAEQVLAKLKTVADPVTSTAFGAPGPFIDPRMQIVMQTAGEGGADVPRADYPDASGYFYVRSSGAQGIKEFVLGTAGPAVTETRQGTMAYNPNGSYLTDYADRAPAVPPTATAPQAVAGTDAAAQAGKDLAKFPRPVLEVRYFGETAFVPFTGGSLQLSNYPIDVRLSSPVASTSAQLLVAWNSSPLSATTNPYLFAGLDISNYPAAKPVIKAQIASLDTLRYTNSDPLVVTFSAVPGQVEPVFPTSSQIPATLTYLEAGGPMIMGGVTTSNARPPVTVSLSNIEKVPSRYLSLLRGELTVASRQRYTGTVNTATNANFSRAGGFQTGVVPIDVQGFGTADRITIDAWIESDNSNILISGDALNKTVSIATTPLVVDVLPLKPIGLPPSVTISSVGNYPSRGSICYTLITNGPGTPPLNPVSGGTSIATATVVTNTNLVRITNYPIATYTVTAQATGPTNTEHWFTCSPVGRTYIAIMQVPLKYIGLNMKIANISGYVKGSIYMQAGNFAVLNAGATIAGNVYVPGLPSVTLPGGTTKGNNTVVDNGSAYVQSTDDRIDTNRITGREYSTEGDLADPQSDLRKIVDLYGSNTSTPATYDVKVNNTARIDGKLYRKADPPPVSTTKPSLPSDIIISNAPFTVTGTNTLGAGSYALTLDNTNSVLRLGSPGTITSYVFGLGSTWTAGRVEILGPVQIYLNAATSFNGVTFGSSNSIYQTGFVVMSNYTVSIDNLSTVYGQFEARDSEIIIGSGGGQTTRGSLFGSAFANKITVDGSGYVDVSGGTSTNIPTPSPTPTPRPSPSPSPSPVL